LYFYNARWYDPYLNRWIQPDTIVPQPENPQSLNRYSYVRGNPLKFIDPTGHGEECGPTGRDVCTSDWPDIFVGKPKDVAEAWAFLNRAKMYGPNTRQFIESRVTALQEAQEYGGPTMQIQLVRNVERVVVGSYGANAIDLSDVEKLPDSSLNPLAPPIAMLHEFTEQYTRQFKRATDQLEAHYEAIRAENSANTERYGAKYAPIRPYGYDRGQDYDESRGSYKFSTITYNTTYPEIGGRTQCWVTLSLFGSFSVQIVWRHP
jgi:hypothetical protein